MISTAILNKAKLGHKVQPMKDGRVFVSGELAVIQARKLVAQGKIKFVSMGEKTARGFVYQGICTINQSENV